jgi:tape measure domain-containing protein
MEDNNTVKVRVELDTNPMEKGRHEGIERAKRAATEISKATFVGHQAVLESHRTALESRRRQEITYTSWWERELNKRDRIESNKTYKPSSSIAERRRMEGSYSSWWERELSKRERRETAQAKARQKEVDAIHKETARQAKKNEEDRIRAAKSIADAETRTWRHQMNEYIKLLELRRKASGGGSGGSGGGGGLLGGLLGSGGAGGILKAAGAVGVLLSVLGLLTGGLSGITGLLKDGAQAWLEYSARIEQAHIGFTTLLGSSQAATAHIKELQQFAVKSPFQFEDVAQASRRMQTMGVEMEKIMPLLKSIGNAASAAGGDFEHAFQRAAYAFGEVYAKGKLTGEEVRQLANNGIPVVTALATQLGKSKREVIELVKDGRIGAELFTEAFKKFADQKFGDSMEKQSRTFNGAMSNVKDALYQKSAQAFAPLFDEISKVTVKFADALIGADGITGMIERGSQALAHGGGRIAEHLIIGMIDVLSDGRTMVRLARALDPQRIMVNFFAGMVEGAREYLTGKRNDPQGINAMANAAMGAAQSGGAMKGDEALLKLLEETEGRGRKVKSELEQLQEKIRELKKDISGFLDTGSAEFDLRIQVEDAERFRRDLESIITLRRELSLPLKDALPQNGRAAKELKDNLESYKRVRDAVNDVEREGIRVAEELATVILTQGIPVIDSETRYQLAYAKSLRERIDSEAELTAELNVQAKKRVDILNDTGRLQREVFTNLRIDVIKDNVEAKTKELRAALRRAISEGREESIVADLKQQLEVNVKNEAPSELKVIGGHVKNILDALTKGRVSNPAGSAEKQNLGSGTGSTGYFSGDWRQAKRIAEGMGLVVTSTTGGRHNKGSLHPLGRAIDVDDIGMTPQKIAALEAMGFRVKDERTRPKGQKVWGGSHYHLSWGFAQQQRAQALLDPQMRPTSQPTPEEASDEVVKVNSAKEVARISGMDLETIKALVNGEFDDRITNMRNNIGRLAAEESKWANETEKATYRTLRLDEARGQRKAKLREQAEDERVQLELLNDELRDAANRTAEWTERVQRGAAMKNIEAQTEAKRRIVELQYEMAHAAEGAADRYTITWLEAAKEIQQANEEASHSIIRSQVKMQDQTVFHSEQARARIYEHMASAKGYTDIVGDAFISASDAIGDGMSSLFGKVNSGMGKFGEILTDIQTNLMKMVTNRLLMKLVDMFMGGGSSSGGVSVGGGGQSGGGFSLGNILGGVLGGGRSSGTAPFNPNAGSGLGNMFAPNGIASVFGNQFGGSNLTSFDTFSGRGGASNAWLTQGAGSPVFSAASRTGGGLMASLRGALPMLGGSLGLSLGGMLGGQSRAGRIIGSLAGGAAGLAGGLAGYAALGGTFGSGALGSGLAAIAGAALPIAAVAAPLLVGAYLLSRNAQRRRDETTRNELTGTANTQLEQLIRQVRNHQTDPASALAQAADIRQNYMTEAGKLKDRKARNHALLTVRELDYRITQLRSAATTALNDNTRRNITSAFATGGVVSGQRGEPRLILAHGGEIVASLANQTPELVQAAADAGIPAVRSSPDGGGSRSGRHTNLKVELVLGTELQNKLVVNGMKSDVGYKVLTTQMRDAKKYDDI